jgi:FKBP-type peptidyl-prolyl cis-trans isomerase
MSRNAKNAKAPKAAAYAAATKPVPTASPADEARKDAGAAFLSDLATQPGWHSLPSGVVFRIVRVGRATPEQRSPTPEDTCTVHYRGTLIDGTKFDSSYDRAAPLECRASQLIRGWGEVLQFMGEGDKWEIAIPWHQAYGKDAAGPIVAPYSALRFEIELQRVQSPPPAKKNPEPPVVRLTSEARAYLAEVMEKPFEALVSAQTE